MTKKIHAIIRHQTQDRIRIKLVEKENALEVLGQIERMMKSMEGVKATSINPYTRSILITHANKLEEILSLFYLMDIDPREKIRIKAREKLPQMRTHIKKKIRKWDKNIIEFTDGELDLNFIVGIALTGMGYYQTAKGGRFLPPGESLFVSGMLRLLKETSLENEL